VFLLSRGQKIPHLGKSTPDENELVIQGYDRRGIKILPQGNISMTA
jgi:hypothetical protein